MNDHLDLVVVGGCGHVGLPLALSLADCGYKVGIDDIDAAKVEQVKSGHVPFLEKGAEALLKQLLPTGRLELASDASSIARTDTIILVIGTPIDEFMNPSVGIFERVIDELLPHLNSGSLIVLRSTVFPGTTDSVALRLRDAGVEADVVFCPERIAEGHALEELRTLPQVVGASSDAAFTKASRLFARLGGSSVATHSSHTPHRAGLAYGRVLDAVRHDYPRAADFPGPGFAAGPCLLKDPMQLSAYTPDQFPMGQAAMQINEGLPNYIVDALNSKRSLQGRTVGILGMAFKGESDDPRASLSYKLRKLAAFKGARVMCTDPYVEDASFQPLDKVLRDSDVIVIGAPHRAYRE